MRGQGQCQSLSQDTNADKADPVGLFIHAELLMAEVVGRGIFWGETDPHGRGAHSRMVRMQEHFFRYRPSRSSIDPSGPLKKL